MILLKILFTLFDRWCPVRIGHAGTERGNDREDLVDHWSTGKVCE